MIVFPLRSPRYEGVYMWTQGQLNWGGVVESGNQWFWEFKEEGCRNEWGVVWDKEWGFGGGGRGGIYLSIYIDRVHKSQNTLQESLKSEYSESISWLKTEKGSEREYLLTEWRGILTVLSNFFSHWKQRVLDTNKRKTLSSSATQFFFHNSSHKL